MADAPDGAALEYVLSGSGVDSLDISEDGVMLSSIRGPAGCRARERRLQIDHPNIDLR